MNKRSKIYIAGHKGLVGSAIQRVLERNGYENLVCQSSSELNLTEQDRVHEFFEAEKPEYVFLAAAKVGGILANRTYPAEFLYNNLMIQSNVIHAAYRAQVKRLLFLGSSCIYPKLAPQPLKEEYLLSGPLEETNEAYAIAKISGIKLCQAYRKQYGCDFGAVMPTNLYGPNDNFDLTTSHVLPALIRKCHEAKENNDSTVTIWGSGSPRREFLHVDDLAEACLFLMAQEELPDLINVGTGMDLTIRELAELVCRIVGYQGQLRFDPEKPDGTLRKVLDISKLKALGFSPKISLETGIAAVYQQFRRSDEPGPPAISGGGEGVISSNCVTVIMPVYNGETHLPEAVSSVLSQTHTDFELILINDGSTDSSLSIMERFADSDSRIRVMSQNNRGIAETLNTGLKLASTEWAMIMHADDVMHSKRLERQIAFIQQTPGLTVASCLANYIGDSGKHLGKTTGDLFTPEKCRWYVERNETIGILHPGVALKREAVLKAGGYRQSFWPAEDIDLWNRLAEMGHLILIQNEILMDYRIHTGSVSTSKFRMTRLKYEWVRACMRSRRNHLPEPDWQTFQQEWNTVSFLSRLDRERKANAKAFYHAAGHDCIRGDYWGGLAKLGLAALLQPAYVIPRLKEQVFR